MAPTRQAHAPRAVITPWLTGGTARRGQLPSPVRRPRGPLAADRTRSSRSSWWLRRLPVALPRDAAASSRSALEQQRGRGSVDRRRRRRRDRGGFTHRHTADGGPGRRTGPPTGPDRNGTGASSTPTGRPCTTRSSSLVEELGRVPGHPQPAKTIPVAGVRLTLSPRPRRESCCLHTAPSGAKACRTRSTWPAASAPADPPPRTSRRIALPRVARYVLLRQSGTPRRGHAVRPLHG
jgi:hypothetical protein